MTGWKESDKWVWNRVFAQMYKYLGCVYKYNK